MSLLHIYEVCLKLWRAGNFACFVTKCTKIILKKCETFTLGNYLGPEILHALNHFQLRNEENQIVTFTFSQPQNTIWKPS